MSHPIFCLDSKERRRYTNVYPVKIQDTEDRIQDSFCAKSDSSPPPEGTPCLPLESCIWSPCGVNRHSKRTSGFQKFEMTHVVWVWCRHKHFFFQHIMQLPSSNGQAENRSISSNSANSSPPKWVGTSNLLSGRVPFIFASLPDSNQMFAYSPIWTQIWFNAMKLYGMSASRLLPGLKNTSRITRLVTTTKFEIKTPKIFAWLRLRHDLSISIKPALTVYIGWINLENSMFQWAVTKHRKFVNRTS